MTHRHRFGLESQRVVQLAVALVWCASMSSTALSADWPQFRGTGRDGNSSETGLLKQWPERGPKLLWAVEDVGTGYASVVATDSRLYTTGLEEVTGYLYAYDLGGKLVWKKPNGQE